MSNTSDLLNKVALVTGASRGIGESVALQMAQRGADVAINFRSKGPRAEAVAEQVRAAGRRALLAQADLTSAADLQAMAQAVAESWPARHPGAQRQRRPGEGQARLLRHAAESHGAGPDSRRATATDATRRLHRVCHQPLGALLWPDAGDGDLRADRGKQKGRRGRPARPHPRAWPARPAPGRSSAAI